MVYFQFLEIPWNQNMIKFWFVPEIYLVSWVLISVNAKVILGIHEEMWDAEKRLWWFQGVTPLSFSLLHIFLIDSGLYYRGFCLEYRNIYQALLHVFAPSLYFYNIRKMGVGGGHFLTFSNEGEGAGPIFLLQIL